MKALVLAIVSTVLISASLFSNIKSQVTTRAPVTISPANQNLIASKVQQFNSDIQVMRQSGTVESQKLIADIQAIVAAARSAGITIPTRVQSLVQDVINNVQQVEKSGRNNTNQLLMILSGAKEEVMREINMAQATLAMTG